MLATENIGFRKYTYLHRDKNKIDHRGAVNDFLILLLSNTTGSSRLMRISLLRFFKAITKIWLMRFYGLFILLLRT